MKNLYFSGMMSMSTNFELIPVCLLLSKLALFFHVHKLPILIDF